MLGPAPGQVIGVVPPYLKPRPRHGGCHDRLVASGTCATIMSNEQMLEEGIYSSVSRTTQFSVFVN
jgi:hypothetical protein